MNPAQHHSLMAFLLSTALPLSENESAHNITSWQHLAQKQYDLWAFPFERAVAGGFCSLNMGTAFMSGYQGALQAIAPEVVDYNAASFCVTESGGHKPSAVATTLSPGADGDWILNGQKSFVSGAEHARRLLVAASTGIDAQGRNRLALVWLDTTLPGVEIMPLPALPFAPDISHGTVQFHQVIVPFSQRLQGDGYSNYVKPFRTVEDLHVSGAILGYWVRLGRELNLPHNLIEALLALISLHQQLAQQAADDPATHLALAGARTLMETTLDQLETALQASHPGQAQCWERDKALLSVAGKARTQRTETAWQKLTPS